MPIYRIRLLDNGEPSLDSRPHHPKQMKEPRESTLGRFILWRCRESNPGPLRPNSVFYVRSRAIAYRPPRFVRHIAVAA